MTDLTYDPDPETLKAEHSKEAIEARVSADKQHSYVRDAVLGAIDGSVTTFAMVCGVMGGQLDGSVAVLLGFAKLFADGFSMAVSNFEGTKSESEIIERAHDIERRHIEEIPDAEVAEVREIYRQKGFDEETIDRIVEVVTEDEELWIETMITEEWQLPLESPNAYWAGGVTFAAFCVAGLVPLVPFVWPGLGPDATFAVSAAATGATFVAIGLVKGKFTDVSMLRSGLTTLLTGGGAAATAYLVGYLLRGLVGGV
ncbi:MAG: VIT1/CCC1 transporter family protein [Bradymonadaceae bacterium]